MSQFFASFRRCRPIGFPIADFNAIWGNSSLPAPHRWISSTSVLPDVVQGTSAGSQVKDSILLQHEQNRRDSRTLYRQMIRFCKNLLQQGFPKDIVWYYIPFKHYNAPEHVDPSRLKFLYETFEAVRLLPINSVWDLERIAMDNFDRTAELNVTRSEDVSILRRVMQLLSFKTARYEPGVLHLTFFEVEDMIKSVRALFRLNHVRVLDPIVDGEVSYETNASYEKERRALVFKEMEQLNEMYSLLQTLRANREVHIRDKPFVPLSVGQVVQHQRERWRGVIVDWEYHDPSRMGAKPSLSDDFSTIAAAYNSSSPFIVYTTVLDDYYVRKGYDSLTTTVAIMEDSASLLSVVTDPYLCRIRNDDWRLHFQGYDLAARRFRLNSRKEFEYPTDFTVSENTDSVSEMTRRYEAEEDYGELLIDILDRVCHFAARLDSIIVQCITEERLNSLSLYQPFVDFHFALRTIIRSRSIVCLSEGVAFVESNLCGYLQKLNVLALEVFEAMYTRRQAEKQSDGSFCIPPLERFKNGSDMGDNGVFRRCMEELETELNQWHYRGQVATLPCPDLKSKNDSAPDDTLSISQLIKVLQRVDHMDNADPIRETIKLMRKAHKDIAFRSRLEEGFEALIVDNLDRALKIFGKIVVDDPTYVECWYFLSSCYCLMGLYDKAKETIQMVLSLDPNHFLAKSNLGCVYDDNNEHKEAERWFRECLDLDPWCIDIGYKVSECVDLNAKEEKG